MRTFLVMAIAALLIGAAFAQIPGNVTIPDGAVVGPIEIATTAGDSVAFGSETINGKAVHADGLVILAKEPFRYFAKFPWGNDTAISVPVDSAYTDLRGEVEYPCVAVVPGATWATISTISSGDTIFVRPYYIVD